jgi:putative tricarboxylic transport membrane protein
MADVSPGRHQRWMLDRPKLITGIILLAFAAVTAYDAYSMSFRTAYGLNPNTASYLVAGFLTLLGIGHFWSATRPAENAQVVEADWLAIGTMALGLGSLIGCIYLGAGFIAGSTLLFAFTAHAFGRRAFLIDLVIGFVIALAIFFLFNKLLTLTLPQGPLERLL